MTEQSQEMPTLEGHMSAFPATILNLLKVQAPPHIPAAIQPVVDLFLDRGVNRIVLNVLDNFGLFEITYYKPEFLISQSNALTLLSTPNPYTLGIFHQMMFGGFDYKPQGFHMLDHLQQNERTSVFIGRERDVSRYDGGTASIAKTTDMATWIEAAKVINRHHLSILHFLDFEEIHRKKQRTGASSPEDLIQKLIKRTDKWILSMYKQLRSKSLMIVLGNHGRYKIDLEYQGKIAQWRAASVPLALFLYKE